MNDSMNDASGTPATSIPEDGSVFSYTMGFLVSIALTLVAFLLIQDAALPRSPLIILLIGLALAQIATQLFLFLHLGSRASSKWNVVTFVLMLIILCIIVVGSLWTMQNLDTNMMPATPADWTAFLSQQE